MSRTIPHGLVSLETAANGLRKICSHYEHPYCSRILIGMPIIFAATNTTQILTLRIMFNLEIRNPGSLAGLLLWLGFLLRPLPDLHILVRLGLHAHESAHKAPGILKFAGRFRHDL